MQEDLEERERRQGAQDGVKAEKKPVRGRINIRFEGASEKGTARLRVSVDIAVTGRDRGRRGGEKEKRRLQRREKPLRGN